MNLILVLVIIALVLFCTTALFFKLYKSTKEKNKELKKTIEKQRENITSLVSYTESLSKIKDEKNSLDKKIQKAESDEEIYNIINSFVRDNNGRVQNSAKK